MMRDGAGGRRAGTYPEVYSGPDHCSGTVFEPVRTRVCSIMNNNILL